jgi:phosphoribosylamine---glycine ligase
MSAAVCQVTTAIGGQSAARIGRSRRAVAPLRAQARANKQRRVLVVYALTGGRAAVAASGDKVNVLVIGSGGREHSLCWRLKQSPTCGELYCTPGNAGIIVEDGVQVVDVKDSDHAAVVKFCKDNNVGLVVVGPEAPLVDDIPCFGPTKDAARLEGSKGFLKDLLRKYNIPTAKYERFTDPEAAKAYIQKEGAPIVVKTDGLAAGKGVIVAMDVQTALDAVDDMMVNSAFGSAGAEIVVEDFLDGEEASFFAVVGGGKAIPLVGAQDHKRVGEGDTGLNTGGMGAYSPAPVLTPALEARVMKDIIQPTVDGMAAEGCPFTGVIFAGLMIEGDDVKLLEHNVRFGDPECQCVMTRMRSDLVDLLLKAAKGELDKVGELEWSDEMAINVVVAADGYPGSYAKGEVIEGLDAANAMDGVKVFHAGTAMKDGKVTSAGGRVLGVTATGKNITEAAKKSYAAVDAIQWPGGFVRRDIGYRAIAREK